ncbi:MAG: apolipoprotein N-acyltransferase, partial [Myxococcota bacterium]
AGRAMLWSRIAKLTREAAEDADLLVWPEGGFPFAFQTERVRMKPSPQDNAHTIFSRRLVALATALGQPFVASGLRAEDRRLHNSALFFDGKTREPQVYDKHLLLWFGERIPFSDTFPSLAESFPHASNHRAGEEFVLFDVGGARWAPNICYEALFPTFTRRGLNAGEGADVLLNMTNDVWFGSAQEAEHHLMVQVQRAIENRVWLVRATNSGISAFVDPAGNTLARGEADDRLVVTYDVRITDHPRSFYRRYGDLIYYVFMGLSGAYLAFVSRLSSRSS